MTSVPSFSSPELQRAVHAVHSSIGGLDESRNKVSADIKSLEGYLAASGLTTEFALSLGQIFVPADEEEFKIGLEEYGSASGWIEEESLLWAEDRSGKFRLLHELCRWKGGIEVDAPGGPYFRDQSSLESERRPLIETKVEVRMRVQDHLPRFVVELAQHLGAKDLPLDIGVPF